MDDKIKEMEQNDRKIDIIECQDCEYFRHLLPGVPYCTHLKIFVNYGWFCADGIRRDKNGR